MESEPSVIAPINIAISSCLLGEHVRYDGTDKKHSVLSQIPKELIQFIPICPEVAIGMGIPRPPIQLVDTKEGIQALQIDNPNNNFTEALQTYGKTMSNELDNIFGYIFKARSPSCGINSTPVFINGAEHRKDTGLFAAQIIQTLPDLPVTEEATLTTLVQYQSFFNKVFEYSQQKYNMKQKQLEKQKLELNDYLMSAINDL